MRLLTRFRKEDGIVFLAAETKYTTYSINIFPMILRIYLSKSVSIILPS